MLRPRTRRPFQVLRQFKLAIILSILCGNHIGAATMRLSPEVTFAARHAAGPLPQTLMRTEEAGPPRPDPSRPIEQLLCTQMARWMTPAVPASRAQFQAVGKTPYRPIPEWDPRAVRYPPSGNADVMLGCGILLLCVGTALRWLTRDRRSYTKPEHPTEPVSSACLPALVMSTRPGYQTAIPRKGPGRAASHDGERTMAASVG